MILAKSSPAKVNLFWHVTDRRPNGYHAIEGVMVTSDIADTITIDTKHNDFTVSFNIADDLGKTHIDPTDNTVYKAGTALAKHHYIKPWGKVVVEKHIPVGAGLGGGSSNAAAALLLFQHAWGLPDIGIDPLDLGADIPFCIRNKPSFVYGTGGEIIELDFHQELRSLIVWPRVLSSTPKVYGKFANMVEGMHTKYDESMLNQIKALKGNSDSIIMDLLTEEKTHNSLYGPAISIVPEIADAMTKLQSCDGCILARMTGSGSAVFGFFNNEDNIQVANKAMEAEGYWSRISLLNSNQHLTRPTAPPEHQGCYR